MPRTNSLADRALSDPILYASLLAAELAADLELPAGNMWEPGMARNLLSTYEKHPDWREIEKQYRAQLGL